MARIGGMRAGRVAHFALMIAIVNVAACLIANRAMTHADQASMGAAAATALRVPAANDQVDIARSTPLNVVPGINQSRIPVKFTGALIGARSP